MSWSLYYDRDGQAIDLHEWERLRAAGEIYIRVARTDIGEGDPAPVCVSTVWTGLNSGGADEPPLTFETMVFGGKLDGRRMRYTTEAEARQGHDLIVRVVLKVEAGETMDG